MVVCGGKMTQAGSSWGEKVITPNYVHWGVIRTFDAFVELLSFPTNIEVRHKRSNRSEKKI
jgi:hypothetical protein